MRPAARWRRSWPDAMRFASAVPSVEASQVLDLKRKVTGVLSSWIEIVTEEGCKWIEMNTMDRNRYRPCASTSTSPTGSASPRKSSPRSPAARSTSRRSRSSHPHIYIEAPTLGADDLAALREPLLRVAGVLSVAELEMLPGARRRLYLDALMTSLTDPVLAVDGRGVVVLANAAAVAVCGMPEAELAGRSLRELTGDPALVDALVAQGARLPVSEVQVGGQRFLMETVALHDAGGSVAGAVLTLHAPQRLGERISALQNHGAGGFEAILGAVARDPRAQAARHAHGAGGRAAADPRRDRHRQGTGGPGLPRRQPTPRPALLRAQLRGPAREPGRERAVRLRQRRLHRRAARRPAGPAGADRRRHRCSSTKWARCRPTCRPSCCAS